MCGLHENKHIVQAASFSMYTDVYSFLYTELHLLKDSCSFILYCLCNASSDDFSTPTATVQWNEISSLKFLCAHLSRL